MDVDRLLLLTIGWCVIGAWGVALSVYWLYWISKGITPSWFTQRTNRMALRHQRVLALWSLTGSACIAAGGLAFVFEPGLRAALEVWLSPKPK